MILRAPNTLRLIQGKKRTFLTDDISAASGTLTVESGLDFAVGQYLLLGQFGDERSEVVRVHTATIPTATTITLNANTSYRHEVGTPIFQIDYDQVEFSRATTEAGNKSVLATSSIAADSMDTIYDDTVNSTGFGFYRFKNSAATTYTEYSSAIPYAGWSRDAAQAIFDKALAQVSESVTPRLLYDDLYNYLNDFVDIVNEENYTWSELKVLNTELATLSTGDWEITLPTNVRRRFDPSSILSIRPQNYPPLTYLDDPAWTLVTRELIFSTNTTVIADSDTSIVLTNSANFYDSGTIYINGDAISYTANDRSTNTLSGVTGISTGGHAAESYVLQNATFGTPVAYTFSSEGNIKLWPIADASVNNRILYGSYYRMIPYATSQGSLLYLKNVSAAVEYVAYRIRKKMAGGSLDAQDPEYQSFLTRIRTLLGNDPKGQPQRMVVSYPTSARFKRWC